MGWLSAVWGALFGGGNAVETVAKAADNLHYSGQEQAADTLSEGAQVRQFAAPGYGGQGVINDLVDAYNRAIRPGVTTWLCGGYIGWWNMPEPGAIDPYWQEIFLLVITFWFGGRMLLKDLPKGIAALMEARARIKRRR